MVYPTNLQIVSRKLTDNIVIGSSAFKRAGALNFGARMALFEYNGSILVWSALPYGNEVVKSLQLLTGKTEGFNISHLVVPDVEHTLAAASFREHYPEIKIIGPAVAGLQVDHVFTTKQSNRLLAGADLKEIGITEEIITENFEFVFLGNHKNKELVVFDKTSKILFEADLLFNLGVPGSSSGKVVLEQYSPETGFPKGFNPHSGKSFLTRYMQPKSSVGNFLGAQVVGGSASKTGLKLIHDWNFHTIVMCHGNVITEGAKEAFQGAFKGLLK